MGFVSKKKLVSFYFNLFDGIKVVSSTQELQELQKQLDNYFLNHKPIQYKKLFPQGTDFQNRVWRALLEIPMGSSTTYGALARKLNSHPRAIGQACKNNPWSIIIPCHRVISQKGLGGYSGHKQGTLFEIKPKLLAHEGDIHE